MIILERYIICCIYQYQNIFLLLVLDWFMSFGICYIIRVIYYFLFIYIYISFWPFYVDEYIIIKLYVFK